MDMQIGLIMKWNKITGQLKCLYYLSYLNIRISSPGKGCFAYLKNEKNGLGHPHHLRV